MEQSVYMLMNRSCLSTVGRINDNRAVTVFCSSDTNAEIYADTYNSMVELAADI